MKNKPNLNLNPYENHVTPYTPMPKLAHAYVPFQYLGDVYPPAEALHQGTVFPELDSPYGKELEYVIDE